MWHSWFKAAISYPDRQVGTYWNARFNHYRCWRPHIDASHTDQSQSLDRVVWCRHLCVSGGVKFAWSQHLPSVQSWYIITRSRQHMHPLWPRWTINPVTAHTLGLQLGHWVLQWYIRNVKCINTGCDVITNLNQSCIARARSCAERKWCTCLERAKWRTCETSRMTRLSHISLDQSPL